MDKLQLRYLIVSPEKDQRSKLHLLLGTTTQVLEWYEAENLAQAAKTLNKEGHHIHVIFIDPLQYNPQEVTSWIFNIRIELPWIVFVLYLNGQGWDEFKTNLTPAEAKRLDHYYQLDASQNDGAFEENFRNILQTCSEHAGLLSHLIPFNAGDTRFLGERHGLFLFVSRTSQPWLLEGDAIVIPVSNLGDPGTLGVALLSETPGSRVIKEALFEISLTPDEPLVIEKFSFQKDEKTVFCATSNNAEGGALSELAVKAFLACCQKADAMGHRTLIVPPIGGGSAGLDATTILKLFIESIDKSFKNLERIIFVLLDEKVFEHLLEDGHSYSVEDASDTLRSQPLKNDIPSGPDLLDIETETRALADAISLKDMIPPVVVGILGGWGSGKSFALHLMEQRFREIQETQLTADQESPYVGHTYLVRFDAWVFAKSNLWASLMQKIFSDLNRQLGLEKILMRAGFDLQKGVSPWAILDSLSARDYTTLKSKLGQATLKAVMEKHGKPDTEVLWTRLKEKREDVLKDIEDLETQKQSLASEYKKLKADVENQVEQEAQDSAWEAVRSQLTGMLGKGLEEAIKKKLPNQKAVSLKDLSSAIGTWRKIFRLGPATPFFILCIFSLLFWAFNHFDVFNQPFIKEFSLPTSFTALISGLFFNFSKATEWLEKKYKIFEESKNAILKDTGLRDKALNKLKETFPAALQAHLDSISNEADLEKVYVQQLKQLDQQIKERRSEAGITGRCETLFDFVQDKVDSKFYDDQLGLLHQIQKDLQELTDALEYTDGDKSFPRGAPRIILEIDDLDRCPPEQVVEVFEATQLLVKTKLFVVVLAMDVRYVTRALEKEYEGILTPDGNPSGLDYIEKIIQIPYRIPIIKPDSLDNFFGKQMKFADAPPKKTNDQDDQEDNDSNNDEANTNNTNAPKVPRLIKFEESKDRPLPSQVLTFDEAELKLLKDICTYVGVSPRSGKRLVNVFKLLKIIWHYRHDEELSREIKSATLLLLVLSAQFPKTMRYLIKELENTFGSAKKAAAIKAYLLECLGVPRSHAAQCKLVSNLINNTDLLDEDLSIEAFGFDTVRLVHSFSFVGEEGDN